jgi:hypothetical protein
VAEVAAGCSGGRSTRLAAAARSRATLLVAFFLLASAAMAYAECAWVLWGVLPQPPQFTPVDAFYTGKRIARLKLNGGHSMRGGSASPTPWTRGPKGN